MKNKAQFNRITDMEMEALFGGAIINNGDSLITPIVASISRTLTELSRIAMEYQASLPPSLKK